LLKQASKPTNICPSVAFSKPSVLTENGRLFYSLQNPQKPPFFIVSEMSVLIFWILFFAVIASGGKYQYFTQKWVHTPVANGLLVTR
jgi:hypothetical protein